jgi:hypothetical protein
MSMAVRLLSLFLLLAGPPSAAAPPPLAGEAFLVMDEEHPTVGQTVEYHLKVALEPGWELRIPEEVQFHQALRAQRERISIKKSAGAGKQEWELSIPFTLVRLGRIKLAERSFEAVGPAGELATVKAGKLVLTTGSLFATENEPLPGTPLPPLPVIERNWLLIWTLAILGTICVAVVATLLAASRFRRRKPRPGPPPIPAHVAAFQALDELARQELEKKGEFTRFYTLLSLIFRGYLGGRFGFDSMDMTTTEIVARMKRVKLEHFQLEELVHLLEDFDLVKFAKMIPTQTQAAEDLARVRKFVAETRPAEALAASPAGPAQTAQASAPGGSGT